MVFVKKKQGDTANYSNRLLNICKHGGVLYVIGHTKPHFEEYRCCNLFNLYNKSRR